MGRRARVAVDTVTPPADGPDSSSTDRNIGVAVWRRSLPATLVAVSALDALLDAKDHVLLDGSMGTELFGRGLRSGLAPELWNRAEPAKVRSVHDAYLEAGSAVVLTNSFGGTSFRLALHGLESEVLDINRAAAKLARASVDEATARDPGIRALVAGSMGPTGELLEPFGSMTPGRCRDAFAAQAEGLAEGGVDLLWIETMSSLEEVELAVEGCRRATGLDVCATMSFDTAGRTMMGVSGREAAERLGGLALAAIGANCGNNLGDSETALAELRRADPDIVVISKCNAGIPEWRDGGLHYDASLEDMAAHAHRVRALGARLIGGCCGTTPDHIALMGRILRGEDPVPDVAVGNATVRPGLAGGRLRETSGRSRRRRRAG